VRRLVHWIKRPALSQPVTPCTSILDEYRTTVPSARNAVDIFKGEWSSRFPDATCETGRADLFNDKRISWAGKELGGFGGKKVLELGPLEGGHSYMLQNLGAASVLAVEGNTRAFLKCLVTKELLGLARCRFLCGDFVEYLRHAPDHFDIAVASGVLYHMRNPVELIALIAAHSDHLVLWTHYYDEATLSSPPARKRKFPSSQPATQDGFAHTLYRYEYNEALNWGGFCGGSAEYSNWLTRDDILGALCHFGFKNVRITDDTLTHQNGPCFTLVASKG
jgi:hypothetical protein